jgi:hypothetical protein
VPGRSFLPEPADHQKRCGREDRRHPVTKPDGGAVSDANPETDAEAIAVSNSFRSRWWRRKPLDHAADRSLSFAHRSKIESSSTSITFTNTSRILFRPKPRGALVDNKHPVEALRRLAAWTL